MPPPTIVIIVTTVGGHRRTGSGRGSGRIGHVRHTRGTDGTVLFHRCLIDVVGMYNL